MRSLSLFYSIPYIVFCNTLLLLVSKFKKNMSLITKTNPIMITTVLIIAIPLLILGIIGQRKIHVKRELTIDKNIDKVWEVLGKQFGEVHLWSSNFKDSKPGGDKKFDGIDYSYRATITDRGETTQLLDAFDAGNYRLAYHITKGMPGIAKSASGIWSLKPVENNQATVVIEFDMEVKNMLGYLLSPLVKLKIGKSADEIAEELKYYMENGKAQPRNN
jgi:hypothetical protein